MKRLLVDYLRRYLGVLAAFCAAAMAFPALLLIAGPSDLPWHGPHGKPGDLSTWPPMFVFLASAVMWMGPAILLADLMSGAGRVSGALPVGSRARAAVAWLEGVVLAPVLCVVAGLALLPILASLGPLSVSHWIVFVLLSGAVGLACNAVWMFFPARMFRDPTSLGEGILTSLIVLGFVGGYWAGILALLPRHADAAQLAVRLVLMLPVAVAAGWLALRRTPVFLMHATNLSATLPRRTLARVSREECAGPFVDVPFLLTRTIAIASAITGAMAVVICGMAYLCDLYSLQPQERIRIVLMLSLFSAYAIYATSMMPWIGSLRALRMTPRSAAALAASMVAQPALGFAIHALGLLLVLYPLDLGTSVRIAASCFSINLLWGIAVNIVLAKYGGPGSIFVSFLLWIGLMPFMVRSGPLLREAGGFAVLLAAGAVLVGAVLAKAFVSTLRNSHAPYRRKPLLSGGESLGNR